MPRPLSVLPLAGMMLGAALIGAGCVALVANSRGVATAPDATWAAGLALGTVLAAAVPGIRLVGVAARGGPKTFGLLVVAAGSIRILSSLFVALAVYFIVAPEGRTFWSSFLVCGLVCLVVETAWAMLAARSMTPIRAAAGVPAGRSSESNGAVS